MRIIGTVAATLGLAVGALAFVGDAEARHGRVWRHGAWHHNHHRDFDARGAGILGFAAGAVVGGALAQPRYYGPRPYYYYGPETGFVPPYPAAPDTSHDSGSSR